MKKLIIFFIRGYQVISWHGWRRQCRFYPSCSAYAIEAIQQYGIVYGMIKSFLRICKCHPFHPGGYNPLTGHQDTRISGYQEVPKAEESINTTYEGDI